MSRICRYVYKITIKSLIELRSIHVRVIVLLGTTWIKFNYPWRLDTQTLLAQGSQANDKVLNRPNLFRATEAYGV